jgi:hypothetical protein
MGRTPRTDAVAGLAAVGVAVSILFVTGDSAGPIAGGPLGTIPAHGFLTDVRLGETMTDGQEKLDLGNEPAIITGITVVGGNHSLKYLGALIASPQRRLAGVTQQFRTYPPKAHYVAGTLSPAVGAVLKPVAQTRGGVWGYELLIGYRYIADRVDARTTICINYTVDGVAFVLDDPARLVTCPTTMSDDRCYAVADRLFPDG